MDAALCGYMPLQRISAYNVVKKIKYSTYYQKRKEEICSAVAILWVNEVFDVRLEVGEQLFVKLPTMERKDKQLQARL